MSGWGLLAQSSDAPRVALRWEDGLVEPLPVRRWMASSSRQERRALSGLPAPVLDIGCGPGRHVLSLRERGVRAVGVEPSSATARLAARRGVPVMEQSVFDPIPGTGRWGGVLLLDGNIGIGGHPEVLLERVRELLRPGGYALVEAGGRRFGLRSGRARLESGRRLGPWFDWARVGIGGFLTMASRAGFSLCRLDGEGERWFARLQAG
jgi:SAM-dependent methyltransferase